jgi:hypothetical protein
VRSRRNTSSSTNPSSTAYYCPLIQISDIAGGRRPIVEGELKDLSKYLSEEEIKEANSHLAPRKIENYWSKSLSGSGMIRESMGK